jgi:two-component system sensor histidine kinase MtrB
VAIASHELRTPASAIYGTFVTLAQLPDLAPETREELMRVGYEQAERLRRLTEQLLDLSQLDARRLSVNPERLVVRETLEEIVRAAVPADTDVNLQVPPSLTAVVDPMVLDRIVSNLLSNAARYGSPPIVVSAEREDHRVRVTVEDGGPGVPEELRLHMFDRFARSSDALGPGLGLTIARAYARAHGGDVVFAPGTAGARFELTLPQGESSGRRLRRAR